MSVMIGTYDKTVISLIFAHCIPQIGVNHHERNILARLRVKTTS